MDFLFKALTKPALMFGIPIIPFLLVVMSHFLLIAWSLILISGFVSLFFTIQAVLLISAMKALNKEDPHRISQYFLHLKNKFFTSNKSHFGVHSMSPIKLKRR